MSEIPNFEDWEQRHREAERMTAEREIATQKRRAEAEAEAQERKQTELLFNKTRQVAPYIAESLVYGMTLPNVKIIERKEALVRAGGISGLFGAKLQTERSVEVGDGWMLYGHVEGNRGSGWDRDYVKACVLLEDGSVGYVSGKVNFGCRYSETKGSPRCPDTTSLSDGDELYITARDNVSLEVVTESQLEIIDSANKSYDVSEQSKSWRNEQRAYSEEQVLVGLSTLAFKHGVSMEGF